MNIKRLKLITAIALLLLCVQKAGAQSYSVRTNLIGLASTNINIEASMTLNQKWSLHVPVQYNPFRFSDNKQFRNFYIAPGARWWWLQSYIGTFFGMYATAGKYSVGNLFGSKYRYEGEAYGISGSIGRAYPIAKRWNIEWEVGAGLIWMNQEKYVCKRCGDLVKDEHKWRFLPTRAAVNIVYLF